MVAAAAIGINPSTTRIARLIGRDDAVAVPRLWWEQRAELLSIVEQGRMVRPSEYGDLSDLPALRPLPTAAERAADVIRDNIFEGRFAPGAALPESALAKALQVSRNTVREAFRSLTAEHLLTYEAHKGVMVRWLTVDDVRDIYQLRRMFELGALDLAAEEGNRIDLAQTEALVTTAEREAKADRWSEVGTTDLLFHAEIVKAHRSPRIDEVFRRLMTEMRLGFLAFSDQGTLHRQFVARNRMLHDHIDGGRLTEAHKELAAYLDDAEQLIITAVQGES
jgi:DNA-binding GntR family transcriptional regulator